MNELMDVQVEIVVFGQTPRLPTLIPIAFRGRGKKILVSTVFGNRGVILEGRIAIIFGVQ